MSWAARFQLRQHFRQSLWAVPLLGAIAGAGLAVIDLGVEARVTMPGSWSYSPSTAISVLTTVSGAMVGLLGLVVTVGVLVVQMATGTLSPRFMRLWYRDRLQKLVLAAFTATFAFSFALLGTIEAGSVPDLGVTMAGFAVAVDLVLLLLYLDRFVHALRPVAVAAAVARSGRAVVAEVDDAGIDLQAGNQSPREVQGRRAQVRSRKSGAIQAMDARGMVAVATRHDLTCVLTCSVGDFVNAGSVVMDVYGSPDRRVLRRLRGKIALGHERTIDQDPAYALRIIVDIAIRALSPAVNDPTTATQMINYLGAVLTDVGERELGRHGYLFDAEGHLRLAFRMRTWDDYLHLGVSEIREYGRGSPQVCRRLRAMLADLEDTVLPVNRPAVRRELEVLDRTVRLSFIEGPDQAFALGRDRQGIGGASQAPPVAHVADGE
ncbi:DUF2254 domain-containing protein [Nocardioides cavernae]|uniref:DUF2254 domain-containing protein n=1 Tax=Nocardioides cavernae TaxID=1921566 RepID=A0ABR8N932_9ACTN|nr:DUF2254 domain-containing protein [Nocardioides cavernae]MBD3923369.1 DUF2254 domain-containing protein [Nocardioides cavernae]MBM7511708.1 putative membrane protein [Nocardioides cavernae]